ncbi:MAG: hypothetical protein JSV65_19470 [Armatimonadota bacterium]|nr:MAG: hypothetical protein JSV65_19470 [Armatimonadota bacterium]
MNAPESILLNWLLLFPFIAAAVIAAFPRVLRFIPAHERQSAVAAPAVTAISAIGLSLAVSAAMGGIIARGGDAFADYLWTPDFFQFRLRLDALGLYALLATLAGLLICALWAAAGGQQNHVRWAAFAATAGAFTGVVLAADLVLLYMFWELSVVALWAALAPPNPVGRRFLTWNCAGGVCLLVAIVWVANLTRDTHIYTVGSGLLVHRLSSVKWVGVMLALGLGVRLSLVPVHFWALDLCRGAYGRWNLALLGSAIVIAAYASVRLVFYILPTYAAAAVAWVPIALGLLTVAYAGARAVLADDICTAASHVFIAAAGQVAFGLGLAMQGRPGALAGSLALVAPLALAAPLLAAGAMGGNSARTWSELRRTSGTAPVRLAATIAGAWTLSGLPPLAGFSGLRAVATAAWQAGSVAPLLAALIAPTLIAVYAVRAALSGWRRGAPTSRPDGSAWHWWWLGAVVVVSLTLGLAPGLWWPYLLDIARALTGG